MAPTNVETIVAGIVIKRELKKLRLMPSQVPATQ